MKEIELNETMELTGDVFIVPNSPARGKVELFNGKTLKEQLSESFPDVDNNTRFIQTWICIENLTDNLHDHGFRACDKDGNTWHVRPIMCHDMIPSKVFDGKKEGDTVSFKIKACATCYSKPNEEFKCYEKMVDLQLTVALAQTKYRYRRFGTFEECLARLVG